MTIIWSVTNKDGSSFPLAGKEVHLYYTCERGRFEADVQIQDNVVAWDFAGRDQRVLGGYTLTLEVIQPGGKRIIRKDICNAFTLVGKECEEKDTPGDADINEGGEITLVSELDVYKIQPIIPTVGSNSNWFVDGTDTGKPSTGKSAYEYAKEKGYEGTESEYAESLKLAPENAEKLTELSKKTDNVEVTYLSDDSSDEILVESNNGEKIVHITEDGADFKKVRVQGKEINTDGINHASSPTTEDSIECITEDGEIVARIDDNGLSVKKITDLNGKEILSKSQFYGKRVLFFGDSLVAASAYVECVGGFVRLIAEKNDVPYNGFLHEDAPTTEESNLVGFKNIAKDGATLRVVNGTSYSVVERVKNWVHQGVCDLAIIQGGTNDLPLTGEMVSSYDGGYDITTSIGALEEIFFYVTGLGIKCCFLIMHKVSYIPDDYYDKAIAVCKKWGVPFINLTHSSGFYMSSENKQHGMLYSIHPNEWDAQTTYWVDNKVMYEGKSYKSLIHDNVGIVPSSNSNAWQFVSDFPYDMCHLSDLGHRVIANKIESFIKSV